MTFMHRAKQALPVTLKHRSKQALLDFLVQAYARVFGATDEYQRFSAAEDFSRRLYPTLRFSEYGRIWLEDEEFFAYYRSFDNTNFHSADRKYLLRELVKLTRNVSGDYAECGVFRGASAVLLCDEAKPAGRRVHLFDSFAGLPEPGAIDGTHWTKGDLSATEEQLQSLLGVYPDVATIHAGWIPDRFVDVSESRFALLHVDVDLYQPTLDSLAFFYPRLSPGAVVVCDDYGFTTCPGARAAFDSFMSDKPEQIIHAPTGQAFVIKIGG